MSNVFGSWPRAPAHYKLTEGTVFVTSGTYMKQRHFQDGPKLYMLHSALLEIADRHEWNLHAWAVFTNHYHFVGTKQGGGKIDTALDEFIKELHSRTAIALNKKDGTEGRKVWQNYCDTTLSYDKSYKARLNYVHQNAVKHGIVKVANQYPYCSARWFESTASRADVSTIYSFGTERLSVYDDFD